MIGIILRLTLIFSHPMQRLSNRHGEGVLTGKSLLLGGSPFRPEATGYGVVYFVKIALEKKLNRSIQGMRCAVSGSGNVAQFATEKLLEFGAKVLTVSDSNGMLFFENGMTRADLDMIGDCKNVKRARLRTLAGHVSGEYLEKESPWTQNVKYDVALPCATQNEIDGEAAQLLVKNGVLCIGEGANMPTTLNGQEVIRSKPEIVYLPGKAANAGGVGVSAFEMSQNAQKLTWEPKEVDRRLQGMMADIYKLIEDAAGENGTLEEGANRAGFIKVATAMRELGMVQ